MPSIFSSWLSHTLEEAYMMVSRENMSSIQNLFEVEKMELIFDITHNMYQDSYLFSLVVDGRGYTLDAGNPSKEKDTWKVKCEAMKQTCFYF